ncbi:chemotaxis protein CheA [Candidatus Albibeggiatoa sp. nov. NOAA]|uniref:chemotaxis protein CheA n=1 Tax=Candidatus Albibeggiatoa sp. nov. NOAA TaxID=3162724 RepID=UPI0032F8870A|nr:chemotaxis protein CheA [Thiotrichaceae bacterium]
MSVDMTEVKKLFFEESLESLDAMESTLLDVQIGEVDKEQVNSIFRCVHSIKGGAGIFQYEQVINFSHVAETLLDEMRNGEHLVTQNIVDLLLRTVDILRMQLDGLQDGSPVDENEVYACQKDLEAVLSAPIQQEAFPEQDIVIQPTARPAEQPPETASTVEPSSEMQTWTVHFKPYEEMLITGNDPINLFRELEELGQLTVTPNHMALPEFTDLNPRNCYLSWKLELITAADKADIEEIFEWVEGDCDLSIQLASEPTVSSDTTITSDENIETAHVETHTETESAYIAPEPQLTTAPEVQSIESCDEPLQTVEPPPSMPAAQPVVQSEPAAVHVKPETESATQPSAPNTALHQNGHKPNVTKEKANGSEASSIRVGIDKVDSLINIVGELVITQSMLDQIGENFDNDKIDSLRNGLAQLERNTRELQESVMRIRMLPISFSFSRFPRLVHDLSTQLGKKVHLELSGEQTELDKTVLEKIGDPLVHLVRNALDHGIEMPEERVAQGKDEMGTLRLHAFHQSGNIIIQISDDGAGFDVDKIRKKAIEKHLIGAEETLTDDQIYEFIFHPGFSTANQVSDLSGRGVGMDVVRRNIRSLGGSIDVHSRRGQGTTFTIRLPLTLAILDGQLIRVGQQIYILSLLSIIESLRVNKKYVNELAGQAEVYKLRDEYIPILRLYDLFEVETDLTDLEQGLLVVVEGDGQKIGLFVDELLSQQQIVIKSLETNYKQIPGISGATILGNGEVALILDTTGLLHLFHSRYSVNIPSRRRNASFLEAS